MWNDTKTSPPIAYSAEEASAMDVWLATERGLQVSWLMDKAGRALAGAVQELLVPPRERVLFVVGPGNNGGDAVVAREVLAEAAVSEVWRPLQEPDRPAIDARTLVVDGLFGVGLARPIEGRARAAVEHVNASGACVLAVDIPSGLCATTGAVVGVTDADPTGGVAIVADRTLTFVGPKQGFFVGAGPRHVGLWRAAPIGFPVEEAEAWVRARRAAG